MCPFLYPGLMMWGGAEPFQGVEKGRPRGCVPHAPPRACPFEATGSIDRSSRTVGGMTAAAEPARPTEDDDAAASNDPRVTATTREEDFHSLCHHPTAELRPTTSDAANGPGPRHGEEGGGEPIGPLGLEGSDDPCYIDVVDEGVLEAVLSRVGPKDIAALASVSRAMRAFVRRAPLRIRVTPGGPISRGAGWSPATNPRAAGRRYPSRETLEAILDSLPTLAPRCAELDLTGAGPTLGDDKIARCVRRLKGLRAVTLDECHKASRAAVDAVLSSAAGGGGGCVEAVSMQRCFGLTVGADLLAAALGWPAADRDPPASPSPPRGPPPSRWCRLKSLALTHLTCPLPPPFRGGAGGGRLTCLSITNATFECSAGELVRALSSAAPRLEILGVGGSTFGVRSRSQPAGRRRAPGPGSVSEGSDASGDSDGGSEGGCHDGGCGAGSRAAELAGAFVALPQLRALECTFGNPDDPLVPAKTWLAPAVRRALSRAPGWDSSTRDSTDVCDDDHLGAPGSCRTGDPARAWCLWDLSDLECVRGVFQRDGVETRGGGFPGVNGAGDVDASTGMGYGYATRDEEATALRAAANCTPPKRFKATPLHMAVTASAADLREDAHRSALRVEDQSSPPRGLRDDRGGTVHAAGELGDVRTKGWEKRAEEAEDPGGEKGKACKTRGGRANTVTPGPWRGRRFRETEHGATGGHRPARNAARELEDVGVPTAQGARPDQRGPARDRPAGFAPGLSRRAEGQPTLVPDPVAALVCMGADVNARDRSGATPLFLAAEGGRGGAAKTLLAAGADPRMRNNVGESPLYIAALKGHAGVLSTLLRHCEDTGLPWQDPEWYGDGWTPLHAAACANRTEIAVALLSLAARVEPPVTAPRTPDGASNVPEPGENENATETSPEERREAPPIVSAKNRYGATALHIAALLGSVSLTSVLLEAGAPRGAQDGNGARPVDIALREGHTDVVQLLRGGLGSEDEEGLKAPGRRRKKRQGEGGPPRPVPAGERA